MITRGFFLALGAERLAGDQGYLKRPNHTADIAAVNGCGRSRIGLLQASIQLIPAIALNDCCKAGPKLRALVGVVSHETMLYADLTTEENLRFHAKLFGLHDPKEAVKRAVERLDVTHVLDRPVRALSRGTRQRVALARALLHDPAVILLDEPYTGLDEAAAASLSELLEELATPERILMLTLHDVVRALSGPRRLLVLSGGRIALDEPTTGGTDQMAETYLGLLRAEAHR